MPEEPPKADAPARGGPGTPLLTAHGVSVNWPRRRGGPLSVVGDVSFTLERGEVLGIVGESGCGKSSLAKRLIGLAPGDGAVIFDGVPLDGLSRREWRTLRRRMAYVFQDPLGALDPRMAILDQVAEPLAVHSIGRPSERRVRAAAILADVGLPEHLHGAAPVRLSGGQRQRALIARSLILEPELLICDEPVSALDVSIQAQILTLLSEQRARRGLTILFISHDLAVVRHVSDRVAVMYLGRIVETGPVDEVFADPRHPYTAALVAAVPGSGAAPRLAGETPSAADRPPGCAFAARCPRAEPLCRAEEPALLGTGRAFACHVPLNPASADRNAPERQRVA